MFLHVNVISDIIFEKLYIFHMILFVCCEFFLPLNYTFIKMTFLGQVQIKMLLKKCIFCVRSKEKQVFVCLLVALVIIMVLIRNY